MPITQPDTDQVRKGEEALRQFQQANGGTLVRGEDGILKLVHPFTSNQ
jgi:hypothetical protein